MGKYFWSYRFVLFPMTLNDLEGHLPVAGLIKCNSTNICATFRTAMQPMSMSSGSTWSGSTDMATA